LQEANCASFDGPRSLCFTVIRRNEDDRDSAIVLSQAALKLKAAHPWHAHIKNQAFRVLSMLRTQELFG
jgi:hypothetical protein